MMQWTDKDPFQKVYNIDSDPARKLFFSDYFYFLKSQGIRFRRLPVMAKSPLDLFHLYVIVRNYGGCSQVTKERKWSKVVRDLGLPASITSAAFTLKTQYEKYLYGFELWSHAASTCGHPLPSLSAERRQNGNECRQRKHDSMKFNATRKSFYKIPRLDSQDERGLFESPLRKQGPLQADSRPHETTTLSQSRTVITGRRGNASPSLTHQDDWLTTQTNDSGYEDWKSGYNSEGQHSSELPSGNSSPCPPLLYVPPQRYQPLLLPRQLSQFRRRFNFYDDTNEVCMERKEGGTLRVTACIDDVMYDGTLFLKIR